MRVVAAETCASHETIVAGRVLGAEVATRRQGEPV
jgi:hypothetical protein